MESNDVVKWDTAVVEYAEFGIKSWLHQTLMNTACVKTDIWTEMHIFQLAYSCFVERIEIDF